MQKTLRQHLEMVYKSRISAGNLCCTVSQERFLARKMRIRMISIIMPRCAEPRGIQYSSHIVYVCMYECICLSAGFLVAH